MSADRPKANMFLASSTNWLMNRLVWITYGLRSILLPCALILVATRPAASAELRSTDNGNCAWRIDGPLREGDADRAISILRQASNLEKDRSDEYESLVFSYFGTRVGVVCLNIPGGPFLEGLSLMRFFRDSLWGTFIDDGDECLSSCAVAFMGGTSPHYDGETRLFRTLHVGGRLAFDLPGMFSGRDEDSSEQSPSDISTALAAALREFTGEITGEKIPYFRLDLLLSIFSLSGDVYQLDSIQKAARYDIGLAGFPPSPSARKYESYRSICNNLIVRAFGLREPEDQEARIGNESLFFEEDRDLREAFVRFEDGTLARQVELKSVYDLDGSTDRCVIGPHYSTFMSSRYERGSYADVTVDGGGSERFFAFGPGTLLSELAKHEAAVLKNEPSDASRPQEVQISSYWLHNGSVMALLKSDAKGRAFIYAEPRAALRDTGVEVGTLLFDGTTTDGTVYEGYSRTFSCGTRSYPVSGGVSEDGRLIVMKGKAARFDQSCNSVGADDDTLVFEFLGSASDREFADKLKPPFGNIVPVRSLLLQMMHL